MHWESKCGKEKKFQCDYCSSKFISHASLKVHLQIHAGTKEFQCMYCDKSFLSAGQLKVHNRLVRKSLQ